MAAFHTSTHLSLIIPYAPLSSLWDLLSSSPLSPVWIGEEELKWWVPQVICAIAWYHDQGYAHRDVKPHNSVVTEEKKILIRDFRSAVPAHGLDEEVHRILTHEAALVQLELEEDAEITSRSTLSNRGAIGNLHRTFSSGPLTRKEDERGPEEFREHPWFDRVKWDTLHQGNAYRFFPPNLVKSYFIEHPLEALHLPQFVYAGPNLIPTPTQDDMS
ncbi:hypothetical protein E1B28_010756 [Marasmius oreades]|uniref:non-specific serine/threonine protein kinase n=1 Tax=Marasmius oreades TaxID=181124 RepID=A0A9P7RTQ4_9AGAR|nr:uncharacterized protein E1B28_010756 [Marasmius oreades]KAG7089046.1 hypothetical protein E1B28_010756 [Marasmius oreades]